MILLVLFSQEQDQSRVYCGKVHSLTLCLRKSVKKSVFGEASLSHHGCSWPLVAQERPEGRPHHPLHCTAVTAEAPRSTRVRSRLHLAYGTVGAELAFLAVC